MFSLVQFDNDEYYVASSKRVRIVRNKDCLVKHKGGSKYHATLIETSDSEEQLKSLKKTLDADDLVDPTYDSYKIHGVGCSTPINGISLPLPHEQTTVSDIRDDERSSNIFVDNSADSSAPPSGCSDIMKIVGNAWTKDFSNTSELQDISQLKDPNSNFLIDSKNSSISINAVNRGEGEERDEHEILNGNEKEKNYTKPDGNTKQDDDGRAETKKQDNKENQNKNKKQSNYQEQNEYDTQEGEKNKIYSERDGNRKQCDYKKQEDGGRAETEKRDSKEERDKNKKQSNYEKQDEYESREGEGKKIYSKRDGNRKQGNYKKQEDGRRAETKKRDNKKNQNKNNKQRHYEEQIAGKGRADVARQVENKENKNKERYNFRERDIVEQRTNSTEGTNELEENDVSDGYDEMQNDYEQHDCDQDYANDESSDDNNDNFAEDSDYIPDHTTISNISSQTFQANLTRTLSKSIIDSLPVDIRSVDVPPSKNQTTKNPKKYFCPYCKKLQTKFARHLEFKHKSEGDVARFVKLPKGNYERAKIIETIRKHGNFLHNTDSNLNTGILITCRQRQPKFHRFVEDYVCCSNCKGFFSKQTLRLHVVKCNTTHKKGVRNMTVMGRRLSGYVHEVANPVLRRTVFPVMRDDEVVRSIKYDELLILFANGLCEKYTHTHQHDMIRAQLRLLGRFKCAIKNINKDIDDFASIFHPKFYDSAISAVRECAKYNSITQSFETPAVATTLGTLIKKCISRRTAQCIRKQDYEGKRAAEEFLVLFEDDFPTTINRKVMEDQTKQRRQTKITLPSKQDIRQLYDFLKNKCKASLEVLENQFDLLAWKVLTESTLILVQIFNRRRAGEIERLLISDYENQTQLDENVNADLYSKLSNESREYAKQFARLTIRGKLGRTVPVLLYPLHVACIDMILKHRTEAGIKPDNEYIFSVPHTGRLKKKYLRACALMRKFSQECGAIMPTSLRGTTLRKHIATFFAMEGIGENEVADLANFMGHDKRIHENVYRVPIPIREVTHVSRLLEAAMGQSEEEESTDQSSESEDERNGRSNYSMNVDSNKQIPLGEISQSDPSSGNSTDDISNELEEFAADAYDIEKDSSKKRRSNASQVRITKHVVPEFVESGKDEYVILECDYVLEKTPPEKLAVKWFRNDVDLVYQWINDIDKKTNQLLTPQSTPPFDKYIDFGYKASDDQLKMWRSVKFMNPTPELTGNYTCTVFGVSENEATSKKPMIVYSTGKNFSLIQSKKTVNGSEGVELTCYAEDLFPRPNLQIYVDGKEHEQRPEVTQSAIDSLYAIRSQVLLMDKDLKEEVTVGCNLTIPEARYAVSDDSVYYPGSPITTTTSTTTLQRKMDIQASDNSQPDTVNGSGSAVSSIPNGLIVLLISSTLAIRSSML